MAIEKIKREKNRSGKAAETVGSSPVLEAKRKEFQEQVKGKKPIKTREAPKHHSSSKRTLIIAVAAFLAVVGTTGAAYAYLFWYQSPERIVLDAVRNASSATSTNYTGTATLFQADEPQLKFSGAYTTGKSKVDLALKMPLEGDLSELKASTITYQNSLYIKINHASKLIEQAAPPQIKQNLEPYLPVITSEVDDNWMRIGANEITTYQPITQISECNADVYRTLTTEPTALTDLTGIYMQQPFVQVSEAEGTTAATGVYDLMIDRTKFDEFKAKLYKSKFFASLGACTKAANDIKTDDFARGTAVLTVDKATRTIKEIKIKSGHAAVSEISVKPTFNDAVSIEAPKTAVTTGDVQAKAFSDAFRNSLSKLQ